jgi:cobalt-zinc-cadmium efflux system outer membrane protein
MNRTLLSRSLGSTIQCSRNGWVFLVLTAACAHGAPPPTAAISGEGPAPHLRASASSVGEGDVHEHADPVPDPLAGAQVSLGGILAYADVHAPVLAVARSTRSRAEAARIAAAPVLPTNPELALAVGPRFERAGTGVDLDVSLQQSIEIAGERGLRLAAADRMRELTEAEIEQIRWFVHCDVHAAFHRALVEQERARLADRVTLFQEGVLRVVERQIAAGETPALTLRLAQAEVAQARQLSIAARQSFWVARIRLAQLAGWPVASPPAPEGVVDTPRQPESREQLVVVAREHLPGLRESAARIREAEARSIAADRASWARPSIGVQYRREGNPGAEGTANIVMGTLGVPLPTFQRNQAERAKAHADAIVATAELEASLRLLEGQVTEAHSEVVAAAQRANAYGTEILPRFEENLTLLQRSFELGEIDILALSTGRERFLRIQSDALAAQLDYFVALAGLERVVGVDLWHDDHHAEAHP